MKSASVFSAFNARWLEPEDVARSFIPTLTFKTSVITLKPAIHYQFKTGQRDWPRTIGPVP
jgi:hypothetical protein